MSSLIFFDLPNGNGYTKDRIFSIRNFQHTFTQIHSTINDFLEQLIWKIVHDPAYWYDLKVYNKIIWFILTFRIDQGRRNRWSQGFTGNQRLIFLGKSARVPIFFFLFCGFTWNYTVPTPLELIIESIICFWKFV